MDHVLTDYGLRLTYLNDRYAIDDLNQDRILDDLSGDTPDGNPFPCLTRYRLADYDHLVLVTDRSTGRHLAFLAATDGVHPTRRFPTSRDRLCSLFRTWPKPDAANDHPCHPAHGRHPGYPLSDRGLHSQPTLLPHHARYRTTVHRRRVLSRS